MSDIRKRVGRKGTTYQVRYPSKATKSGYVTLLLDGDRLIVSTNGYIYCLDPLTGEIVNRTPHLIRDVELLVQYHWRWKNEFKPGKVAPGRTDVVNLPFSRFSPDWIATQRWFRSKQRPIAAITEMDRAPLTDGAALAVLDNEEDEWRLRKR